MLEVTIRTDNPLWDEDREQFVTLKKPITLQLEHSLISLSKWESIHCKAFLKHDPNNPKTTEELIDYIRCMTINPKNVDPRYYYMLTQSQIDYIYEYIDQEHTATNFAKQPDGRPGGIHKDKVTSELIYYWMTVFNIPFECERWHLNRLLTLIHICQVKSQPAKKMPRDAVISQNRSLNAMRKAKLHSKG